LIVLIVFLVLSDFINLIRRRDCKVIKVVDLIVVVVIPVLVIRRRACESRLVINAIRHDIFLDFRHVRLLGLVGVHLTRVVILRVKIT
jgi:hypothetical protein